jgi:hypothetical protein
MIHRRAFLKAGLLIIAAEAPKRILAPPIAGPVELTLELDREYPGSILMGASPNGDRVLLVDQRTEDRPISVVELGTWKDIHTLRVRDGVVLIADFFSDNETVMILGNGPPGRDPRLLTFIHVPTGRRTEKAGPFASDFYLPLDPGFLLGRSTERTLRQRGSGRTRTCQKASPS